jgi:mannose-1-phosphate guanylyltransferase/phosphomannomutase
LEKLPEKQIVILAGGVGSRLAREGIHTPKILLPLGTTSILQVLIQEAIRENFTEIIFCLGNESSKIIEVILGFKLDIKVTFSIEKEPLGTFGALLNARHLLNNRFAVLMGDLYVCATNLGGSFTFFEESKAEVCLLVKFTDHPHDSDLVEICDFNRVNKIHKYPHENTVLDPIASAGVFFLNRKTLEGFPQGFTGDFTRDFLVTALNKHSVIALFHQGIIRDLGTVGRLEEFGHENFGQESLSSYSIVFLDRDGTLNISNGHISSISQMNLTTWAVELVQKVKSMYDYFGIVTNQPVIARGEVSFEVLDIINKYLEKQILGPKKRFDFWAICPHHPDSGFPGEIAELKTYCSCRKPQPGLLINLLNSFHVRSNNALMIGDSISDLVAAERAGIHWIHLVDGSRSDQCSHAELFNGFCVEPHAFSMNEH